MQLRRKCAFLTQGIFKKQDAAILQNKIHLERQQELIHLFLRLSVKYDKGMVTCGQHEVISCQRHKIITGFAKFTNAKFRHRRTGTLPKRSQKAAGFRQDGQI